MNDSFQKCGDEYFINKDDDAGLDYGFKLAKWLEGGTLTGSTWTIEPNEAGGLSEATSGMDAITSITWIKLAGGIVGHKYKVTNRVTANTANSIPISDDFSFTVNVVEN